MKMHYRGLVNGGKNICYMNSVIQALASIASFRTFVGARRSEGGSLVADELYNLFENSISLHGSDASPLLDTNWSLQRSFPLGLQHDAGEFFSLLMEALKPKKLRSRRRQITEITAKWSADTKTRFAGGVSRSPRPVFSEDEETVSPIKSPTKLMFDRRKIDPNPFAGLEAHAPILCSECGPISDAKFTDFLQLILDFKPGDTLIDSLYRYTKAVTIRDYRCDSCSQRAGEPVEIAIRKRTLLGQLPNALCLQLKLAGGDLFKIDAFVKFPLVLDMGPFSVSSNPVEFFGARHPHDRFDQVSEMRSKVDHELENMMKQLGVSASGRVIGGESGYTLVENENPMERSLSPGLPKEEPYLLSAVVVHLGAGVGGGHFVCYRKFHGQWWLCNDERCSPIDEDRVLSSHVYMLFYEKAKKTI